MGKVISSTRPGCLNSPIIQKVHSFAGSLYTALISIFVCLLLMTACGDITKIGKVIDFGQAVPLEGGLVRSFVIVELDDSTEVKAWLPDDQDTWDTLDRGAASQAIRISARQDGEIWEFVNILPARQLESGEISIALLPLTDLSPSKDQEGLCNRIADGIRNRLSEVDALRVIDRESSLQYKGTDLEIGNVGEQLHVSYLLEGSVRRTGDQVQVTLQLLKVANESHLWADSFRTESQDVLTVLDKIAAAIFDALKTDVIGWRWIENGAPRPWPAKTLSRSI